MFRGMRFPHLQLFCVCRAAEAFANNARVRFASCRTAWDYVEVDIVLLEPYQLSTEIVPPCRQDCTAEVSEQFVMSYMRVMCSSASWGPGFCLYPKSDTRLGQKLLYILHHCMRDE